MEKGTKLGYINILYNGEVLKKMDVYLLEKVEFSMLVFLKEKINYVILTILFVVLILLEVIIKRKNKSWI